MRGLRRSPHTGARREAAPMTLMGLVCTRGEASWAFVPWLASRGLSCPTKG